MVQTKNNSGKVEIIVLTTAPVFHMILLIRSFSHFLLPSRQAKVPGLGLSLAYDIVTREHNGVIKVHSLAAQPGSEGGTDFYH
jgi:hypothetical protein